MSGRDGFPLKSFDRLRMIGKTAKGDPIVIPVKTGIQSGAMQKRNDYGLLPPYQARGRLCAGAKGYPIVIPVKTGIQVGKVRHTAMRRRNSGPDAIHPSSSFLRSLPRTQIRWQESRWGRCGTLP